jgi:hypothetical protein
MSYATGDCIAVLDVQIRSLGDDFVKPFFSTTLDTKEKTIDYWYRNVGNFICREVERIAQNGLSVESTQRKGITQGIYCTPNKRSC